MAVSGCFAKSFRFLAFSEHEFILLEQSLLTLTGPNRARRGAVRSCLTTADVGYFAAPPSPTTTKGAQKAGCASCGSP